MSLEETRLLQWRPMMLGEEEQEERYRKAAENRRLRQRKREEYVEFCQSFLLTAGIALGLCGLLVLSTIF